MQSLCYHDQLLAQALLLRIQGKKSVPAKRYLEKNSERESTPTVHFMKYRYIPSIYWNMAQPNMWVKNSFKSQQLPIPDALSPGFPTATSAHGTAGSTWSATACPSVETGLEGCSAAQGHLQGSSPAWLLCLECTGRSERRAPGIAAHLPAADCEHLMFYSREKLDFKWQCIRLFVD